MFMVLPVVLQVMLNGVHVDVVMVQRALGIGAVKHGVSPSPVYSPMYNPTLYGNGAEFSVALRFSCLRRVGGGRGKRRVDDGFSRQPFSMRRVALGDGPWYHLTCENIRSTRLLMNEHAHTTAEDWTSNPARPS